MTTVDVGGCLLCGRGTGIKGDHETMNEGGKVDLNPKWPNGTPVGQADFEELVDQKNKLLEENAELRNKLLMVEIRLKQLNKEVFKK